MLGLINAVIWIKTIVKAVASITVIVVLAVAEPPLSWASDAQEPDGLWSGPMKGETPATLTGAEVIDLKALETLLPEKPVLVDVGPADKKPDDFPADRLWLPTHRSVPGAVWFPGGGAAKFEPSQEEAFFLRMEELTQGDKSKPIVTFCRPNCWGSWNIAKRLVMNGYDSVHWFPGGINSWQDAHNTVEVEPDAVWLGNAAKSK